MCRCLRKVQTEYAGVAELADAPDLGSGIHRCAGSSPVTRKREKTTKGGLFSFADDSLEETVRSCRVANSFA